jgi:PAS domain S-box-containing protein
METLEPEKPRETNQMRLLRQAINSFNCATLKFGKQYRQLEGRVKELKTEVRRKNEALEANLEEIEEIKNHLHNILESLPVGTVVVDLKGRITSFNRSAESISGLNPGEVVGKHINEVMGAGFFQDLQLDFDALLAMQDSQELEAEIEPGGKTSVHVTLSISPLTNALGEKVGTVVTLQDVTQLKKIEERANRTSRLAAMGEMAAKIAHEIRNPLGSIQLFASTLAKDLEAASESSALAESISSGVKSINNIISNLLLFIRPDQKTEFQIIDIHDALKDSLFFSNHLIGSNDTIEVVTNYASKPLLVRGDPELLKQTYLNLILNAIQAMPDGGTLTISTKRVNGHSQGTHAVEIQFADTGYGICRTDMPKVFDPFFTTKKTGTGLGLPIVHNIIKLHGGAIDIGSSGQSGVTCPLTLPLWEGKHETR